MHVFFNTVLHDEAVSIPLLTPEEKGEAGYGTKMLPFVFDEAMNANYTQFYARMRKFNDGLETDNMGRVPRPIVDLTDAEQADFPTNPHFRRASSQKPLELAIYYALLVFNEQHSQKQLQEKELYYIFKNALATHNQCVPDPVYHFAANILYNELQAKDHIALLDWNMLPALMLLLPALTKDTEVRLPRYDEKLMRQGAHALLVEFFQKKIPHIQWYTENLNKPGFKDYLTETSNFHISDFSHCDHVPLQCLVLGTLLPENSSLVFEALYQLGPMRGGFLFTSWNFLARASFDKWRHILVKMNIIRSIIQLPKLLRSGSKDYGAGLILCKSDDKRSFIRMSYMPASDREGEDALDQESILSYVNGHEEIKKYSFLVHIETISRIYDFRLSPSVYFMEESRSQSHTSLKDYAEIFFYSKKRKKVSTEESPSLTEALKSLPQNDEVYAQEISLSDIDASSSFIFAEEKKFTIVKMNHNLQKYLVRNGDILLAFKGSTTSIGKSGLVVDAGSLGHTLTNQSTCIIRPLSHKHTAWLYYQLKSPSAQEWIRAHSSGTNALVVSLEMLKQLPLEAYDAAPANELYKLHSQMIEDYKAVNTYKQNLRKTRESIKKLLGW